LSSFPLKELTVNPQIIQILILGYRWVKLSESGFTGWKVNYYLNQDLQNGNSNRISKILISCNGENPDSDKKEKLELIREHEPRR